MFEAATHNTGYLGTRRLRLIPTLGSKPSRYEYKRMREMVLDASKDYYQTEGIGATKTNVMELIGYLTVRMAETEGE